MNETSQKLSMIGLLDRYAFGWIEEPWSYKTPEFEAFPTAKFARAVAEATTRGIASSDWIYPPVVQRADRHTAGPTIMFLLPSTHYLRIDPKLDRPQMADFLVMVLGFFLGLKLNPAGIGHLLRTPRRMGYLVNFTNRGRDLERAMRRAISFFHAHDSNGEVLSLASAAIHSYLTSQSYQHTFEMFNLQYSVLDNTHRLTEQLSPAYPGTQPKSHAHRSVNLSAFYNIPLPPVFQDTSVPSPNAKRLADARNSLVHEARWLGRPLGDAADSEFGTCSKPS